MAPAMKVTLKYEEGKDENMHMEVKLTLPRKWKEGPTSKLKETFIDAFNEKHGEKLKLEYASMHLVNEKGQALADGDIVFQILNQGEHIVLKHGAAPEQTTPLAEQPAGPGAVMEKKPANSTPISATTPPAPKPTPSLPTPVEKGGLVSSAAALDAARQPTRGFDYSKWDRLDLSDDDGEDCHPNIDKASWMRLMAQKRADRRKKEDEKIAAYKSKIEKYTKKMKDIQAEIDGGNDDIQLLVDIKDAEDSAKSYQAKLDHFLAHRKLVAEDLCEDNEDHTIISKNAAMHPLVPGTEAAKQTADVPLSSTTMKPERPKDEAMEYDQYIKVYRKLVDKYAALRTDEASETFLYENPEVLHEHAEGYLLLLTLDKCMEHLEEKANKGDKFTAKHEKQFLDAELAIARQHLLVQFVLTLSKGKHCDPRDMIRPFFRKTSKQYEDRIEGFEDDLKAFVTRIRNRAKEKIEKGEPSPLAGPTHRQGSDDEEEYELAGVGPGGLDPNEVLQTLPQGMQDAFINQDMDGLKSCLQSLTEEEAAYHMKRCIDSGLWVPGPHDVIESDEEEGDAEAEAENVE